MKLEADLSFEIAAIKLRLEQVELEKKSLKKQLKALTTFLSEISNPSDKENENGN